MKSLCLTMMIIVVAAILQDGAAEASPARKREILLEQPDGSTFKARLSGDEFFKMLTTEDGASIIQNPDGWYCYAAYSADCKKISSGCRVGEDAPSAVIAGSKAIPMQNIGRAASAAKASAAGIREVALKERLASGSEKHGIVILVQFQNLKFTFGRNDFLALLNSGRDGRPGAIDYFNEQFRGLYNFSFDVSEIITLDRNYQYYGENDQSIGGKDMRAAEMVREACRKADGKIDFSLYDDDGDGAADNIFIIYAGPDEAEGAGDNHIWSHAWFLDQASGSGLVLDGVRINRYACTSELFDGEITGIGTFCHEYSHTFGLPDMYDTDYMNSGGLAEGLWGSTSLMDKGNRNDNGHTPPNFNAIEREILGISDSRAITESGRYEIKPVNQGGVCYRIDSGIQGEYFLIECRDDSGWDRYIGGAGLLVYHLDKSENDSGYGMTAFGRWQNNANSVNSNPEHQCADLIEAVMPGSFPEAGEYQDISQVFFPSGEINSLSPESGNPITFWNGEQSIFRITDIARTESGASFTVSLTESAQIPSPVITGKDIFQDAAIISWSVSAGFAGTMHISWRENSSGAYIRQEVSPYSATNNDIKYAVVLEGLEPQTRYDVRISCSENGSEGNAVDAGFVTKTAAANGRPYIYLRYAERNEDGSFPVGTRLPLRLFNAIGAAKIEWTYNGKMISPGDNGYFIPSASGILKAKAYHEDGSVDIITKRIIIRSDKI